MERQTTLLIPSCHAKLAAELAQLQPEWQVRWLDQPLPDSHDASPVWAFIDWIGEDMSGIEQCRRLREAKLSRPLHITMLLDAPDAEDRRRALKAGADDYMTGPLDARKLTERMARYESGSAVETPPRGRLRNGDLVIDLAAHQLRYRGTPIPLRPNEFRLLAHFLEHPDQVFSRTALIDQLGKGLEEIDERTVDVWVGRLRRALMQHGAPDPLRTVRSLGYVMDSMAG